MAALFKWAPTSNCWESAGAISICGTAVSLAHPPAQLDANREPDFSVAEMGHFRTLGNSVNNIIDIKNVE
jgi:hypothetical protein